MKQVKFSSAIYLLICGVFIPQLLLAQQENIPLLEKGAISKMTFDKKGKKSLELEVLNLRFSDSTNYSCRMYALLGLKSVGRETKLSSSQDFFGNYQEGLLLNKHEQRGVTVSALSDRIIPKNDSVVILITSYLHDNNISTLSYNGIDLFKLPLYDNTEYNKRKEYNKRLIEQRNNEIKRDSVSRLKGKSVYEERCNELLTPQYLANWVGTSFFTKEQIEKDCGVSPIAYNGGKVFYDFPKCPVTMEFEDTNNVCVELSFRLFGEDGYNMKKSLIAYGYKLQGKSEDLIAENNFMDLQIGKRSTYKLKLKQGGYSICIVTEGQAMMFTFYRSNR